MCGLLDQTYAPSRRDISGTMKYPEERVRNVGNGVASEGLGRLNIQTAEMNQSSKNWH